MRLESIRRNLSVGSAAAALLVATISVASAQINGSVTGVVNDASGKRVTGAFVKWKNDQKRLTFMVVSREQGTSRPRICRPAATGCRAWAASCKANGRRR
jgi:hypothetical protein